MALAWPFKSNLAMMAWHKHGINIIICHWWIMGYSRKKSRPGVEDLEFLRGIKERACGNSRCQLKKEWNFQRVSKKKSCGISMVLGFWPWNFQEVSHNLAEEP